MNLARGAQPIYNYDQDISVMQSNLGLFDPALRREVPNQEFTGMNPNTGIQVAEQPPMPIRIGQGKASSRPPEIQSEYITRNKLGEFELRGVPANGGPDRLLSALSGKAEQHPRMNARGMLGELSGQTQHEFQRKGNYEKLLRGLLSAGYGIRSDNRNPISNPFHRKLANRTSHLYNTRLRHSPLHESLARSGIGRQDDLTYDTPALRDDSGVPIITQLPPKLEQGTAGNPLGGYGSLARYDFGAVPFRRSPEFERANSHADLYWEQYGVLPTRQGRLPQA